MKALLIISGLPLLSTVLVASSVSADDKKVQAGKIAVAQGSVYRADKEDGPFKRLHEDNDIFEGDFLKTDADSRMEARLNDRSVLRLGADSRMRVEKAKFQKGEEAPKSV